MWWKLHVCAVNMTSISVLSLSTLLVCLCSAQPGKTRTCQLCQLVHLLRATHQFPTASPHLLPPGTAAASPSLPAQHSQHSPLCTLPVCQPAVPKAGVSQQALLQERWQLLWGIWLLRYSHTHICPVNCVFCRNTPSPVNCYITWHIKMI